MRHPANHPAIRTALLAALLAVMVCGSISALKAQPDRRPVYRVNVEMVVVTFSVRDGKGKPVSGLKPDDLRVFEDGVLQKIASFAEGSKPAVQLLDRGLESGGASVFVLFDTSNRMYETFPYACDAIADFVRRLDPADSVAIYTFSRNLSRAAPLTNDHTLARDGLSRVVAGDDTALFNSILLTVRDAAKAPGRKAIVVFSNGPDNASVVAPSDVGRVAENEGIPIYVISTRDAAKDPLLTGALETLTARTGGTLHQARTWQQQAKALGAVREDIGAAYTVAYYPSPNANQDFRTIKLDVVTTGRTTYHVRARAGYQPNQHRSPRE
jgi:VWFA-related protein